MLCAAAAISALYLIFITRTKTAWIYILIVGLSALCALYSESRTALLAIAIDSILFIIYYVRHKILKHDKKVEKSIILLLTCAVLIGAVFVIPYVSSHTDTVEAAVNKDKICQTSQTMTAQLDQTPLDRFETHEVDLNSFASSRFTVWKNYLENLNLIGHNGNKLLYIKDGYDKREWAHNTALEIAYRCGVIPGILFLLIEVYAGIYVLIWLFSKKYEPWRLFSMMGIITFCLYSVLDVVVYPFEHVIMFLFFIAIMPLFKKEKKVHE